MTGSTDVVRFAVIGTNHPHAAILAAQLVEAGAELASFFSTETKRASTNERGFPNANRAPSIDDILEDDTIALVVSGAIPAHRASIAIAAMREGKDVLVDKPGCTSLEQLAQIQHVQEQTDRIWSVAFERLTSPSSMKAAQLIHAGAIGDVFHVISLGPHREGLIDRPDWFYIPELSGGILADLGSHKIEEFLYFTHSTTAHVLKAYVANHAHPDHPAFQDFGEMMVQGSNGATAHVGSIGSHPAASALGETAGPSSTEPKDSSS